jgi:hypothetical protein
VALPVQRTICAFWEAQLVVLLVLAVQPVALLVQSTICVFWVALLVQSTICVFWMALLVQSTICAFWMAQQVVLLVQSTICVFWMALLVQPVIFAFLATHLMFCAFWMVRQAVLPAPPFPIWAASTWTSGTASRTSPAVWGRVEVVGVLVCVRGSWASAPASALGLWAG